MIHFAWTKLTSFVFEWSKRFARTGRTWPEEAGRNWQWLWRSSGEYCANNRYHIDREAPTTVPPDSPCASNQQWEWATGQRGTKRKRSWSALGFSCVSWGSGAVELPTSSGPDTARPCWGSRRCWRYSRLPAIAGRLRGRRTWNEKKKLNEACVFCPEAVIIKRFINRLVNWFASGIILNIESWEGDALEYEWLHYSQIAGSETSISIVFKEA